MIRTEEEDRNATKVPSCVNVHNREETFPYCHFNGTYSRNILLLFSGVSDRRRCCETCFWNSSSCQTMPDLAHFARGYDKTTLYIGSWQIQRTLGCVIFRRYFQTILTMSLHSVGTVGLDCVVFFRKHVPPYQRLAAGSHIFLIMLQYYSTLLMCCIGSSALVVSTIIWLLDVAIIMDCWEAAYIKRPAVSSSGITTYFVGSI